MITLDKPRDSDIHTLADFSELLCLLDPDRVCSRETISDYIKDVGGTSVSEVELDDCFNQIDWRVEAFGDHYPFKLDARAKTFEAPDLLSDPQKLYVFLLLCANFPFLHAWHPLGDAFERFALDAYNRFWPESSKVKAFGKNETDYTGAKWKRINKLAEDVGGKGMCDAGTFRPGDNGDGGIDLVAWMDLDPFEKRNIPSALAQCGCSRAQWVSKQTEISRDRLNGQIHASSPWMQLMFIPHSFRDNHGKWAVPGALSSCIIYDRLRLILSIGLNIDWQAIDPPDLLQQFLDTRLDLV